MSGSLGSLYVEVAANVARFQSDMGKMAQIAESRARQIDGALNIVGNSLKALGAAAVVGLTFEKLRGQVQGAISSAAGLKDLAERTGGTVEKLSGLVGIAKLGGTETDLLAGGIQKLAKAMNEAQNGGKAQAAAFAAVGISTKELKGMRPDEVFEKIARKQAEYADGAGKVAAMQALLGKSGANLIPMMNDLAEAGDLQIKITAGQAEMADEYEKNQKRLAAAHGQIAKVVAMELLPVQAAFTQAMLESATANDGLKKSAQSLAKDGSIFEWARTAAEYIGVLITAADYATRGFQIAGRTIGYIAADATMQIEALANGMALIKGDQSLSKFLGEVSRINSQRAALKDAFGEDIAGFFGKTSFSERLKIRLDEMKAARDALGSGPASAGRKAISFDSKEGPDAKSPGEKFVEQLQRQVEQMERGKGEMLRMEAAQKGVSAAAAPYILRLEEIENRQTNIRSLVEQAARDEEQRAKVNTLVDTGNDAAKALIQQTESIGMTAREQRRLTELRKIDEAVQRASIGATIETRIELERIAEVMRNNVSRALDELDAKERDSATGAKQAFDAYRESATNAADLAGQVLANSMQSMEDALTSFVTTGKLNFKGLADSIIADITRIIIKQQIMLPLLQMMGMSGGGGGILGFLGGLFGGGASPAQMLASGVIPLAEGTNYVPYDGMPAILHKGEAVVPAAYNPSNAGAGAAAGGMTVHQHFTFNGGANDSRTQQQVAAAAARGLQTAANRNN